MKLPKFPHCAMFVGAMNVGKTEYLLRILESEYKNHFEFIVIMCSTILDNNKTSRKWIFNDKNVFIVCDVAGKLNEWIKLFKNTSKGCQTLFIIDSCSAEGEINKKRDALSELAFSGRYRNHYLRVLTQKYNSISKDVREQLKWLCLFFTKDRDSFKDCLRENHVVPDKNERDRLKKCLQDTIVARDTDPSLYNAGEDTDPSLYNACKVKEWANKWAERGVISKEQVNTKI